MVTIGTLLTFISILILSISFDVFIYQVSISEMVQYHLEDMQLGYIFKLVFCLSGIAFAIWSDYSRWRTKQRKM